MASRSRNRPPEIVIGQRHLTYLWLARKRYTEWKLAPRKQTPTRWPPSNSSCIRKPLDGPSQILRFQTQDASQQRRGYCYRWFLLLFFSSSSKHGMRKGVKQNVGAGAIFFHQMERPYLYGVGVLLLFPLRWTAFSFLVRTRRSLLGSLLTPNASCCK